MKITLKNHRYNPEEHRIVYIEYNDDGTPHDVTTAQFVESKNWWIISGHWDFFLNEDDKDDLRHYHSGSGGDASELYAPQWADGYTGRFWIDRTIASFKNEPKNAKELKHPLLIKSTWKGNSTNPFKVSEETNSYEYCEGCNQDRVDLCDKHQYIDRDGDLRYKHKHGHGENY